MRVFSAAVLAGMTLLGLACQGDADFSDAAPKAVTLPAEDYRAEILEVDRLVFETSPIGPGRRAALAYRLNEIGERVKARSRSRFLLIESLELRRLAETANRLESGPSQERLAREWMRIRNNLFDDRSWFARSAADLEPAPATPSAR